MKKALVSILLMIVFPFYAYADFTFSVSTDPHGWGGEGSRYDTVAYMRGAYTALNGFGAGEFMVVTGDLPGDYGDDADTAWTISEHIGSGFKWFPVVGNHDLPGGDKEDYFGANLDRQQAYDKGAVNPGPSGCPNTTYSFDYDNSHFVVLNEYCDSDGVHDYGYSADIRDHIYNWLVSDLAATDKTHIFVFGHEPAYPQADDDNDRERHMSDSLNANSSHRTRFWNLLSDNGRVVAYFCGHTHNYSAYEYMVSGRSTRLRQEVLVVN